MIFGKLFGKQDAAPAVDVGALKQQLSQLKGQNTKLIEHNKMMIAALEFYADKKSWEEGHKYRDDDDATIFADNSESAITADKGIVAQRALATLKKP